MTNSAGPQSGFAITIGTVVLSLLSACSASAQANGTSVAPEPAATPASQRLLYELLAIFAAMTLGFVTVRLGVLVPERGDMAAMGFYTGNVGIPLLIFNVVATAQFEDLNWGVVLACFVMRVVSMTVIFGVAFFAYRPRTASTRQRFLTAVVFMLCPAMTNQIALGFPVIEALYGPPMAAYVAANAIIGCMTLLPFGSVLLGLGAAVGKGDDPVASVEEREDEDEEDAEEAEAADESSGPRKRRLAAWDNCIFALRIARGALLNNVIIAALAGLLFKLAFKWLIEENDGQLPPLLDKIVKMFTSPFAMIAFFQIGTSLRSVSPSIWAMWLVLMKVIVDPFLAHFLGTVFIKAESREDFNNLVSFCFFYGTISTGAGPLILGSKFAPESAELVASAILVGIFASGLVMYIFAVAESCRDAVGAACGKRSLAKTVVTVQVAISAISVACMAALLVLLAMFRRHWGWGRPGKQLLGFYGLVVFAFHILMIIFDSLAANSSICTGNPEYLVIAVAFCQNCARLALVCSQALLLFVWGSKRRRGTDVGRAGLVLLPLVALSSAVLACFIKPHAVNEVCLAYSGSRLADKQEIFAMEVLDLSLLLIMVFIGLGGLGARWTRKRSTSMLAEPGPQDAQPEESRLGERNVRQSGSRVGAEALGDVSGTPGPESLDSPGDLLSSASKWQDAPPRSILALLVLAQAVHLITQVVNSSVALKSIESKGAFSTMLILEYVLVHGQGLLLLLALLLNAEFTALLAAICHRATPWLFADKRAAVEDPQYSLSQAASLQRSVTRAISRSSTMQLRRDSNLSRGLSRGLSRHGRGLSTVLSPRRSAASERI